MQMKEIGQTYQENLLIALNEEFDFKLPCKREIKEERIIYKNSKYLEILESNINLESNNETLYSRINRQSFSQVILINELEEFLFQLRYRIGCKDYVLEFPGGAIEKNESPIKAAEREIREELRINTINLIQLGSCYMDPMRSEFKGYFFKAKCISSIQPFTSIVEGELEESYFFWMGREKIKKYFSLLASSAVIGLYLM